MRNLSKQFFVIGRVDEIVMAGRDADPAAFGSA